jgi:hypothetical protein
MFKKISPWIFLSVFALSSCGGGQQTSVLQAQVANLQDQVSHSFRPPFWFFMLTVQIHHNKLWFAGINSNWDLAQFNYNKIKEAVQDIQKFEVDSPQTAQIVMIKPFLDSMQVAISSKNVAHFKHAYVILTNTCNNCHRAVKYPMNVIQTPTEPPFTDQDFKPQQ